MKVSTLIPSWRVAREKIFTKLKIKPKPKTAENLLRKINAALNRLNATQEESEAIIALTNQALRRTQERKNYHNSTPLNRDERIQNLNEEARRVLGEERARKFFLMCNDPYF